MNYQCNHFFYKNLGLALTKSVLVFAHSLVTSTFPDSVNAQYVNSKVQIKFGKLELSLKN